MRGFEREGKSYATVAIGCTGGRHRSVAIAGSWAGGWANISTVSVRHRDIHRASPASV